MRACPRYRLNSLLKNPVGATRSQVQRRATGTFASTASTCEPQPFHVVFLQVEQVAWLHMGLSSVSDALPRIPEGVSTEGV